MMDAAPPSSDRTSALVSADKAFYNLRSLLTCNLTVRDAVALLTTSTWKSEPRHEIVEALIKGQLDTISQELAWRLTDSLMGSLAGMSRRRYTESPHIIALGAAGVLNISLHYKFHQAFQSTVIAALALAAATLHVEVQVGAATFLLCLSHEGLLTSPFSIIAALGAGTLLFCAGSSTLTKSCAALAPSICQQSTDCDKGMSALTNERIDNYVWRDVFDRVIQHDVQSIRDLLQSLNVGTLSPYRQ